MLGEDELFRALVFGKETGLQDGRTYVMKERKPQKALDRFTRLVSEGYRGLFVKAQDLFDEMYASLADRSSRKLVNRLLRIDVLLIDELGYLNLRPEQCNIFFKLMEERYRRKSTIITTNLDYEQWYEFLGQKSMVDALLSRLRHHCTTVRISGACLRPPED